MSENAGNPPASTAGKAQRHQVPATPLKLVVFFLRNSYIGLIRLYYTKVLKMDLSPKCRFSLKANLDFTYPRGIHVGDYTYIAFHATILSHDMCRRLHTDTRIGKNCFVGAYSMIMPGVEIGDGCIVGSGAVVTKNVPPGCIVAGNPARILKTGIKTGMWGILEEELPAS